MSIPTNPEIPERISLALSKLNWDGATIEDVPARLAPLKEAMIEAYRECERFDINDVLGAIPLVPNKIADVVKATVKEAHDAAISRMPIMRTFARAKPPRFLRGLADLSFVAGKEGDDLWEHSDELFEALLDRYQFREGRNLRGAYIRAESFVMQNFYAGQAVRRMQEAEPSTEAIELANAYAIVDRHELEKWERQDDPIEVTHALGKIARKLVRHLSIISAEEAVSASYGAIIKAGWAEPPRLAFDEAMESTDRAVAGKDEA